MIYHDNLIQGTEEWFKARLGKITGSNVSKLLVKGKGITRDKYLFTLVAEIITGRQSDQDLKELKGVHIVRGHMLEADARFLYELKSNNDVEEVGFIEYNEYLGYSPDGLVGDTGMIEIKCPDTYNYVDAITTNKINPQYAAQIQYGLYLTRRKWCDFIYLNKAFGNKSMSIKRIYVNEEFHAILDIALKEAISRIEELLVVFNANYEELNTNYSKDKIK